MPLPKPSQIRGDLDGALVRCEQLDDERAAPPRQPGYLPHAEEVLKARRDVGRLPRLVVDVEGAPARQRDLTVKRALYARFGVREYWIVDPEAKTVIVLVLNDDRYEPLPVTGDGRIVSRALPGLELTLDQIFGGLL